MKSLKDLLQQSKQKTYMLGQAFAEGTWVENTNGEVGKIHRRGVNYIIAVTSEGKMFRSWVKDIKEHCGCYLTDPEPMKERDGLDNTKRIKDFINKNKRKKTNDD
jgi:hypothetical protein